MSDIAPFEDRSRQADVNRRFQGGLLLVGLILAAASLPFLLVVLLPPVDGLAVHRDHPERERVEALP
jgi:hypothetical protein